MILDRLYRKFLAACIHVGKEPTKRNILKYALKHYLIKRYNDKFGLCTCIAETILIINWERGTDIKIEEFKLFNRDTAKNFGAHPFYLYWWPINDWKSRYRYMKWLIKQYK